MQTYTVKTTLTFTPAFIQRIKTIAQERKWAMSRVIEHDLSILFETQKQQELQKMYASMRKWQGSGSPKVTDASTSIDETLYGDEGAWKGQGE